MPSVARHLRKLCILGLLASPAYAADDWQAVTFISETVGNHSNRLCMGVPDHMRGSDIGCPTYAPSLTTGGHVSITGNVSANRFIGDGSGLTNLNVQGDRIVSGTHGAIVNEGTGTISLTTGGVPWGYFSAGWSRLASLFATTVSSTVVSATNVSATYVDTTRGGTVSGTYGYFRHISATYLSGDGSGLYNVPASAVSGLNLDRITSGSLAVVAHENTGYVSLTTGGSTWGYLSAGWSRLANLFADTVSSTLVSATNVSATYVDTTRGGTVSGTYGYFHYLSATHLSGDGSGLSNVPASAVTGLQQDRIVSGSTNIIAHQDRSLTFTTANQQRMVVSEDGKVGIGTSTPESPLVVSSGNNPQFRVHNPSGGAEAVIRAQTDSGASSLRFQTGASPQNRWGLSVDYAEGNALRFMQGSATERMRVSEGGNVGIGTPSPNATLQVSGSFIVSTSGQGATSPSLYVRQDGRVGIGTSNPSALLHVVDGTISVWNRVGTSFLSLLAENDRGLSLRHISSSVGVVPANTWQFRLGGTSSNVAFTNYDSATLLYLTTGGRVGVGMASPAAALNVSGTISATNAIQVGTSSLTCGAGIPGAIRYQGTSLQYCNGTVWTTLGSAGAATAASSTGAVQFNVNNALAGDTNNFFWDNANKRLSIGGGLPPSGTLHLQGQAGTHALYVKSGSGSYLSAPMFAFDSASVTDTAAAWGLSMVNTNTTNNNRLRLGFYTHDLGGNIGIGSEIQTVFRNRTANGFETDMFFTTKGTGDSVNTERLRITSAGHVGVGTPSPNATLQVSGTLIVSTSAQNLSPSLFVGTNGRIGVRTTSPSAWLHLAAPQAGVMPQLMFTREGHLRSFMMRYSKNPVDKEVLLMGPTHAPLIVFDEDNRVGIGTTGPIAKLDVAGTISASDAIQVGTSALTCGAGIPGAIRYQGTSLQYCNGTVWTTLGAAGVTTAASSTGAVQFNADGALGGDTDNLFWDNANKRLGIATATPAATLQVSGSFIVSSSARPASPTLYVGEDGSVGIGGMPDDTRMLTTYGDFLNGDRRILAGLKPSFHADATGTYYYIGSHLEPSINVADGTTNSGYVQAQTIQAFRRIVDGDAGTLASLLGQRMVYGHYQANASTRHTNLVKGIELGGFAQNGTIGQMMALSISPVAGANVEKSWGIYQAGGSEHNYFAGRIGVGAGRTEPSATLDVAGTISASGAIQVGTSSLTCGAGIPGAIRYNAPNLQFCNGTSWTNIGGSGGGGQEDRIVSGTHAVTVNEDFGLVSLSTGETTWGYLNSTRSYLPALSSVQVSSTNVSATLLQVGTGNGAACDVSRRGAMRYSTVSSTVEYCQGSAWVSMGPSATAVPSFRAFLSAAQSIPQNTDTRVDLDTIDFDTYNNFDTGNGSFTPTVPGTYVLTANAAYSSLSANQYAYLFIRKNGSAVSQIHFRAGSSNDHAGRAITAIVQANGTTDSFDIAVRHTASSAASLYSNHNFTSFSGALISMAGGGGSGGGSDNLGDHTATQDLDMGAHTIVGTGQVSVTNISATYVQLSSATTPLACDAGLVGSMRYTSGTMQVCDGSAWGNVGIGVPTGTISAFATASCPSGWTEYTPARGRFLRGIDTLAAGIDPDGARAAGNLQLDAMQQITGSFSMRKVTNEANFVGTSGALTVAGGSNAQTASRGSSSQAKADVTFNSANSPGARTAIETRPKNVAVIFCSYAGYQSEVVPGISTLGGLSDVAVGGATPGQALIFDGASWIASTTTGGSSALGDRITSGTHAVTVNEDFGLVSLSTGETTWGYLSSGNSYLPQLTANRVSATTISATHIQLSSPTTVLACDSGLTGSMRYTSGTMQVCDGTSWGNIGIGVPTGTISAFAATACPSGWVEYTPARGRFLRGIDNGEGNDPAGTRAPGNVQADAFQGHWHEIFGINTSAGSGGRLDLNGTSHQLNDRVRNPISDGTNGTPRTANETRPKNVAVIFCSYAGYESELAPGITTLGGLSDVAVGGATTGQVLTYSGGTWIASTTTGGGADNLGNHTATQSLAMGGYSINNVNQVIGGFGAVATTGTLDWNDVSNARSGSGYSLLQGSASNGPGGNHYYHPFSFEYAVKDGTGNMTQFAIGYTSSGFTNGAMFLRTRYQGTWSGWHRFIVADTSGNAVVSNNMTAAAFLYSSDARLKQNVKAMTGGLAKVDALKPVTFHYTADARKRERLGFLAQDVETVFPQAVVTGEDGMKSVDYPSLVPALVGALKELKAETAADAAGHAQRIRELEAANDNLKAANADILRRLDHLESRKAATP